MVESYDIILGAMPVVFLSVTGILTALTQMTLQMGIIVSSLICAGLAGYALFISYPEKQLKEQQTQKQSLNTNTVVQEND